MPRAVQSGSLKVNVPVPGMQLEDINDDNNVDGDDDVRYATRVRNARGGWIEIATERKPNWSRVNGTAIVRERRESFVTFRWSLNRRSERERERETEREGSSFLSASPFSFPHRASLRYKFIPASKVIEILSRSRKCRSRSALALISRKSWIYYPVLRSSIDDSTLITIEART